MGLRIVVVLCALVGVMAVGCGSGRQTPDPARIAPARPAFFAEFAVGRNGVDRHAVESMLTQVLGRGGERVIIALADRELSRMGLSYKRDLSGWVGDRVAVVVIGDQARGAPTPGSNVAVIAPTTNSALAREKLVRALVALHGGPALPASFERVPYQYEPVAGMSVAVIGSYAVFGGQDALHAIADASHGRSLATVAQFARAAIPSGGVPIIHAYYDAHALTHLLVNYLDQLTGPFGALAAGSGGINVVGAYRSCGTPCTTASLGRQGRRAVAQDRRLVALVRNRLARALKQCPNGSSFSLIGAGARQPLIATFTPTGSGARFANAAKSMLSALFGGADPAQMP